MVDKNFAALLTMALEEDLGSEGDITSRAIFSPHDTCRGVLKSKDRGVLCGQACFKEVFTRIDPAVSVEFLHGDGDELSPGDIVARISGRTVSVLSGERISINFLGYLSGIATAARACVREAEKAGKTVILDTRKTLPAYRRLAKYAVKTGGASNHRMGLYDMVLIKDNHIDAAGSITEAVSRIRKAYGKRFKVEVECRTPFEVHEAIDAGVDIIMLDNMTEDAVKESLALRRGNVLFEVSGNMDLSKIGRYAALGVDFISIGKLTHSVTSFDFSLVMER